MTGRFVGFDPGRMATLSTRTSAAVEHLRGVTSSDPAALAALSRVGNVRFELETLWMPAIARVTGDGSMTGWDGDEPEPPPAFDLLVAPTAPPVPEPPPSDDYLTQDHSDLVEAIMPRPPMMASGGEWAALQEWEQNWLIANRPDLVFMYVLRHGIELSPDQLEMLDEANSFVEFSDAFLAKFGLEVGVRWFAVELGGEAELIVMHMSDGTVHVMLAEKGTFGVSVDVGDIEIGAGIYGRAGQTLVFPSEEEAEAAIDTLIAASDVTGAEQFVDFVVGLWPSSDTRSDVQRKVDELWEEYGAETTREVGVYVSAHGELTTALDLEGDASLEAGVYTTTDGDGNVTQEGLRVSGSVSGSASEGAGGATVTGEASFVLDVHTDSATGDEFATLTLTAGGGSGTTAEIVDMAGAGIDIAAVASTSTIVTTTITIPVNNGTVGNVVDVVNGVRSGSLPADGLAELYADADITIAVDQVTAEETSVDLDGGVVEASASVTVSHGENVGTWHKYPDGQMYSQTEVAAAVDEALPAEAVGERRAGGGTSSW